VHNQHVFLQFKVVSTFKAQTKIIGII